VNLSILNTLFKCIFGKNLLKYKLFTMFYSVKNSFKFTTMNVKYIFGENLKFYRKLKNLSQEQLSEKVDISIKHLSSIERGLTFVSSDLLEKLSFFMGVPVFSFFVNKNENIYDENILNSIDRIVEEHLIKTIAEIKADLRKRNQ
jgi:transcriptional regulator with XRE-family HTH domain